MYDEESLLVENTVALIAGKWRMSIVCNLAEHGPTRYNELKRRLRGISQRVLTAQLKRLEAEGLLTRHEFAEVPPRVEYALTDGGRDLERIILAVYEWGARYLPRGQARP